jgi:Ni/Fe-hydrogenase b-type cytochrome subunit
MQLAPYLPGGVMPAFFGDEQVAQAGTFEAAPDGSLHFQPNVSEQGLYVFGYSAVWWIDWLGVAAFLGTVFVVLTHAWIRYDAASKAPHKAHQTKEVYMYTIYERLWHWLQAAAIILLIFTGLIIHKPAMFGAFSFAYVVQVHNVLGFILLINAFLAVFYHVASGEIRQYIPKPSGFFSQMITQATFYVRGIFKNEEHPFEKTPDKKLNPLQQVTYFGLLNVLLPLQIITGVLIWGVQIWPDWAASLGGLPLLAPLHSLIAWLLASFIVMHMYLTTTGHTVLGGVQSMINGWDEVEVPTGHAPAPTQKDRQAGPTSGQMETI